MSNDVYIVGIDMIRFGRFDDAKPETLAAQAALMALDDCGKTIHDIQAIYAGTCNGTMMGQRMLHYIGQTGVPVVNVTNACATGATAFREAYIAIKAGITVHIANKHKKTPAPPIKPNWENPRKRLINKAKKPAAVVAAPTAIARPVHLKVCSSDSSMAWPFLRSSK